MESCNSGSMQSSSGCDEDYDHSSKPSSHHDHSFSNFFNSTTPNNIQLPPSTTIQPISLNTSSSSSSFFDPLPNYLDTTFSRSPPILDDTSWLRPPLPADSINNLMIPSSLSTHSSVVVPINNTITAPSSSVQQRPGISPASRPRNSKKRSRASRRAPTTVLTTDTANFRAMVQEFTGIPTASFMPYSSLPPPRFDLLHSLPPYLLRPFAQKVHHHHHHQHPSDPSPPLDHVIANSMPTTTIHATSNAHTSAHTSTTTTTTSLGLNVMQQQQQQQQQNPIHTFQSLQDQPPPAANISTQLTSKAPLEFDWQKGTTGQSHEGEDQRGAGMDSWVLSSD